MMGMLLAARSEVSHRVYDVAVDKEVLQRARIDAIIGYKL